MNETKINKYGMEPLTFKNYFVYGMGNFASQLSWTMVGTYLSIFYTDVFGLGVGAVAMLMLIAKVWDGINDGDHHGTNPHEMGTFQTLYICRRAAFGRIYDPDIYGSGIRRTGQVDLCICDLYRIGNGLYHDQCAIHSAPGRYDS